MRNISTPLTQDIVKSLRAGDIVLLTGEILTGRDAAHKRLAGLIEKGESLPVEIYGQTIYYVGPTPARPGEVIGSCGPTTSGRMDAYTPMLIERGLCGMIGKGQRSMDVINTMRGKAVYFAATGGAGALIKQCVKSAEVVAFEDLQSEAIFRLYVENFPLTVAVDCYGGDLYSNSEYRSC